MAQDVKFLKGTAAQYSALATKDVNTFYYITDDSKLYLGTIELSSSNISNVIGDLSTLNTSAKNTLVAAINEVLSNEGTLSSLTTDAQNTLVAAINEVNDHADTNATNIGTIADLTTTATDLVGAVNEVKTGAVVTMTESTTDINYAKVYSIYQGGNAAANLIGTINIPKDMVVSEGVVRDITFNSSESKLYDGSTDVTELIKGTGVTPTAADAGKYIKLTIANATNDTIYIAVKDLVDIYTVQASATQVQLAISANNEISASIVAGSITSTELANDAVTTAKITDANVTKAKLESSVQTSLGKADSAVQSVAEGSTDGTVSVDGTDVNVHGLGSAAYTASTAYDAAGSASAVQGSASDTASDATVYGAKAYADSLLTWGTIS